MAVNTGDKWFYLEPGPSVEISYNQHAGHKFFAVARTPPQSPWKRVEAPFEAPNIPLKENLLSLEDDTRSLVTARIYLAAHRGTLVQGPATHSISFSFVFFSSFLPPALPLRSEGLLLSLYITQMFLSSKMPPTTSYTAESGLQSAKGDRCLRCQHLFGVIIRECFVHLSTLYTILRAPAGGGQLRLLFRHSIVAYTSMVTPINGRARMAYICSPGSADHPEPPPSASLM